MLISCFSFTELARRAAELMPDTGGSMITLTYGGSMRVMPNYNVMGVAKAALEASVRYLAADFGPRGIRVNAISAGPVRTLAGSGIGDARAMFTFQQRHSPLGRGVTLEELGGSALYLLSDLSGGVTGEIHYVDSGYNIISMPRPEELKASRNLTRRDLLGALECRTCHAAGDVGVERRPRRHHLEQPHAEIQRRADRDVGGGKILAEDPRPLGERHVEHVEHPLRLAPAGGDRVHLDLGRDLHHRGLDAARREEQPVEILCAQGIAEGRGQLRLGITLGDIGADGGGFRQRRRRRPSAPAPCPSD